MNINHVCCRRIVSNDKCYIKSHEVPCKYFINVQHTITRTTTVFITKYWTTRLVVTISLCKIPTIMKLIKLVQLWTNIIWILLRNDPEIQYPTFDHCKICNSVNDLPEFWSYRLVPIFYCVTLKVWMFNCAV